MGEELGIWVEPGALSGLVGEPRGVLFSTDPAIGPPGFIDRAEVGPLAPRTLADLARTYARVTICGATGVYEVRVGARPFTITASARSEP